MGHWTPHFTRHCNDWELDIVGTFLSRLRGNLVRRDDNDKVIWKDDKKGLFFFFFFITVDVQASLRALRLISWGPEVNDRVNLQWP